MNGKLLKSLAIVALFFFCWTFAGISSFAYAVDNLKDSSPVNHPLRAPGPEEKFQRSIENIEQTLDDQSADIGTKKRKIKAQKEEIETLDGEIRKQFVETEKKLRDANLPEEILQRHRKFVKHYEDNLNELKDNLDGFQKSGTEAWAEKARAHLKKVKPPKKHTPLDPNKLPHRTPKVERKEPRLKKEDFGKDFIKPQKAETQKKPILVASVGSLKGLLSQNSELLTPNYLQIVQATNLPTPEDLAENIEVQFTPEIIAKAQELGNNPVKIYNWVRNNIEFVPTYGSIQGANMTLLTKQGNAFDTAFLLIALLRASNIPARYVYGTIELPIDKVMNWVGGFTDANAALDFIASGGIPVTGIISGGKVTKARLEHLWVEAYVDYIPSRGAVHKEGDTWIPMDGSFKQYTFTPGIDLQQAVPFDAQAFVDQVKATGTVNEAESFVTGFDQTFINQKLDERIQQLEDFFKTNMPDGTVEDVLGRIAIVPQAFGILPASLPYQLIARAATFSELSDALRHKLLFRIVGEWGGPSLIYEAPISILAGKRITLSYLPATQQDQQQIEARIDQASLPAYLINLVPVLRLEGMEIARGKLIGLGKAQQFLMEFKVPAAGGVIDIVQNTITAGAYYAIGLDPQKITLAHLDQLEQRVEALKLQLESDPTFFPDTDDVIGQLLQVTITGYFAELDNYQAILGGLSQVRNLKPSTAAGMASVDLSVGYLFGSPFAAASSGGITLDVDRFISAPFSTSGDKNSTITFVKGSGFLGSALESSVLEQVWKGSNIRGISTTKVLELANQSNIPIYRINEQNFAQILPQLSVTQAVKNDIVNGINSGKEVTIPQQEISIGSWSGVGYIVEDPNTGAAAYLISGGLAGGASIDIIDLIGGIISSLISAKYGKFGRGLGIFVALMSWFRNIRSIIVASNLNVLERTVLAIIAGAGLILAAIAIVKIGVLVLALVASIAISIVFSLLFSYLLNKWSEAFLDFLRRLFRYASFAPKSTFFEHVRI